MLTCVSVMHSLIILCLVTYFVSVRRKYTHGLYSIFAVPALSLEIRVNTDCVWLKSVNKLRTQWNLIVSLK